MTDFSFYILHVHGLIENTAVRWVTSSCRDKRKNLTDKRPYRKIYRKCCLRKLDTDRMHPCRRCVCYEFVQATNGKCHCGHPAGSHVRLEQLHVQLENLKEYDSRKRKQSFCRLVKYIVILLK